MKTKTTAWMAERMKERTLGNLVNAYVAEMKQRGRTADSIKTNQGALLRFARFAGGLEVTMRRVKDDTARNYIRELQERKSKWENHPTRPAIDEPLSPFTIRKTVKVLKGFGTWLESYELNNPFANLIIPSVPKLMVDTLTEKEIELLLNAMNPNTHNGARNYAMVMLMLDAGPRINEVAGARLADLDLERQQLKVFGKGRKERVILFGHDTGRALMRYVNLFRPRPVKAEEDMVFLSLDGYAMTRNSIECMIRRLRETSGLSKLHAHLLRHTFAVNFLATGGDLETLRRLLGHESLEVTKRYLSGLRMAQIKVLYEGHSPMDLMSVNRHQRRFNNRGATRRQSGKGDDEDA